MSLLVFLFLSKKGALREGIVPQIRGIRMRRAMFCKAESIDHCQSRLIEHPLHTQRESNERGRARHQILTRQGWKTISVFSRNLIAPCQLHVIDLTDDVL